MLIRYHSWKHRPPHRISCRLIRSPNGAAATTEDLPGVYVDSVWMFEVPEDCESGTVALVLDGQVMKTLRWTADGVRAGEVTNCVLTNGPIDACDVTEDDLALAEPDIAVDEGRLQRTWFDQGRVDQDRWDVIVVGTGIGGGTLLAQLARKLDGSGDRQFKVLGLDAGSMLFTGHVANQPRVLFGPAGNGATSLWNSLGTFGSRPYALGPDLSKTDAWNGYEVFALGGRSLFWGGLTPRIDAMEFTLGGWPVNVAGELCRPNASGRPYYDRAEDLLEVDRERHNELESACVRLLSQLLPDRDTRVAPVALRRPKRNDWSVPAGVFSTAELLLAQRLGHASTDGFGPPYLHLGELVVAVEKAGSSGDWWVHGVDLRDGSPTRRRAGKVVLAAGTVETPRIITTSALPAVPAAVGKNFTEHTMAHAWFQIPADSFFCRNGSSANVLSTRGRSGAEWNVHLEINSDRVLDRSRAPGAPFTSTKTSGGAVAAQLIFLGRSDLDAKGQLTFGGADWLPGLGPEVSRRPPGVTLDLRRSPGIPSEWTNLNKTVIAALGGQALPDVGTDLTISSSGSVAHEVGTMRMGLSAADSVVDEDLEIFGQSGLFVCDNSVFPSSPAANPSLTLAALALRLADHLWPR